MGRPRKSSSLGMNRLYAYHGKRATTYYTITPDNERINLGHDLLEAKRKLLAMEEGRSIAGSIGELLDDYLGEVKDMVDKGKRAPRTLEDNKAEVVNLKKAFGIMRPNDLQPPHVWQYLHKFRGKKAPTRANREIAFLQAAYNWALGQGIVRNNPCIGVKRNEETPRERLVIDEEFYAFLKFCRSNGHLEESSERKQSKSSDAGIRIALSAEIAYLTGKAQAQILRLHKTQINDEGIEFGKRKRGSATLVEWTPALRAAVDECLKLPSEIDSMFLICNRHGQPYSRSGFKSMWQRLQVAWEEAGNARFTFHDLRAKAVTDLIESGRKASELTGHRTESIPAKVYDRRAVRRAKAVK